MNENLPFERRGLPREPASPVDDKRHLSADPPVSVSVIVPCYNGEAFLEQSLRSALAQRHVSVEVIVVDDGSTDSSPWIARQFPVRYVRQENRGLSEARNTGIRLSRGAYLVFLDADDRLLPDAIASGLRALESHPDCAIAVGDHCFIEAGGSWLRGSNKERGDGSPFEALLRSNFIEMIASVLFRRSVFERVGTFDASLRVAEDYDLYLRIARVRPICFHDEVIAEYRIHSANTSRNSEMMLTTTLQVLDRQAGYIAGRPEWGASYRRGRRSWRRQYGRQLAQELARSFSALAPDDRRRKLRTLLRWYPQGLLMLGVLYAFPSLAGLGAGFVRRSAQNAAPQPAVDQEMFQAD